MSHAVFATDESDVIPHGLAEACDVFFFVRACECALADGLVVAFADERGLCPVDLFDDVLADARAEDEAFEQRVARESVCAVHASGAAFAASPEAEAGCAPGLVHADAAHVVVRSRRDGQEVFDGIKAGLLAEAVNGREFLGEFFADATRVEEDLEAFLLLRPDAARDDVAWGELSILVDADHEALSVREKDCAFATQCLGEERQRIDGRVERRGVELDELDICENRARASCDGERVADGFDGVRGIAIDAADSAAGEDDGGRSDLDDRVRAVDDAVNADDAAVTPDDVDNIAVFDDLDIVCASDGFCERALDLGACAVTVRVQNPAPAVCGLPSERQLAIGGAVELRADFDEFADTRGTFAREDIDASLDREAVARDHRIHGVELGRVVFAHRACDAALGDRGRASAAEF